jgi:F-type H+-transporting ATPase subunit delta
MKNFLIADRYARGLSAHLTDVAMLEPALAELTACAEIIEASHDLRSVLGNPSLSKPQRQAILKEVGVRAGAGAAVLGLLEALLRRGRISLLHDVLTLFAHHVDTRLNRVLAKVTSAEPLDAEALERVRAGLALWSGKTVRVTNTVKPSVIGGIAATIGGTVMDGTIKARLRQLRTALLTDER